MAKIRVIFYKARWGDKHWLDNAISTWTWLISAKNRKVGPYSHVEIWTPQSTGLFKRSNGSEYNGHSRKIRYKPVGTCWTSTMRGKDNGTVKRPASEVIQNPKRWDCCEIEVTDGTFSELSYWMGDEVDNNMGYSKRDILKFLSPIHFPDDTRNICSEFVNDALAGCDIIKGMGIVSPRRLAYKLIQAEYTINPMDGPTQQDINNIITEVEGE